MSKFRWVLVWVAVAYLVGGLYLLIDWVASGFSGWWRGYTALALVFCGDCILVVTHELLFKNKKDTTDD